MEAHLWADTKAAFQGLLLEYAEKPAQRRSAENQTTSTLQEGAEEPIPLMQ